MESLHIPSNWIENDDADSLSACLTQWEAPNADDLFDLLEQTEEKPHMTLCLLDYLHQHFDPDMIQAARSLRAEKDLGTLDFDTNDWSVLFDWEIINNGCRILRYLGTDEDVLIPELVDDCPVCEVSLLFFTDCVTIRSLIVPESIRVGTLMPWEAAKLFGKQLLHPDVIVVPNEKTHTIPKTVSTDCHTEYFPFFNTTIRDTALFGHYCTETDHASEPIRWRILSKEDSKALLIAESVIEKLPYHTNRTAVFWPDCALREWLNHAFFTAAFSETEQSRILDTYHTETRNPVFHFRPNPDSTNKIFLLSPDEWEQYHPDWIPGSCPLWLRMPGLNTQYAVTLDKRGQISWQGELVNTKNIGVLPAMWVRL